MNKKYKENFIQAGAMAKHIRLFGKSLIQKGASYNEVIANIQKEIKKLGAIAAFPPQIALNEMAAHFLPHPSEDIELNDQVVKLDIGVSFEGAIGDTAVTVDLSGKHESLVKASEMALQNAIAAVKVGIKVSQIGKIIEDTIHSWGYNAVRNLCGHGLGLYKVHMPPNIPNYDDRSNAIIKAGMTFAIEPFATTGSGFIYEVGPCMLFSFAANRMIKDKNASLVMERIKTLKGLPFSMHDLLDLSLEIGQVATALDYLLKNGAIYGYGPLIEEKNGMVAQSEHSLLVDDDGQVIVSTL